MCLSCGFVGRNTVKGASHLLVCVLGAGGATVQVQREVLFREMYVQLARTLVTPLVSWRCCAEKNVCAGFAFSNVP